MPALSTSQESRGFAPRLSTFGRCVRRSISTPVRNSWLLGRSQKRMYGTRCPPNAPTRRLFSPRYFGVQCQKAWAAVKSSGTPHAPPFRTRRVYRHDASTHSIQPRTGRSGFCSFLGREMDASQTIQLPSVISLPGPPSVSVVTADTSRSNRLYQLGTIVPPDMVSEGQPATAPVRFRRHLEKSGNHFRGLFSSLNCRPTLLLCRCDTLTGCCAHVPFLGRSGSFLLWLGGGGFHSPLGRRPSLPLCRSYPFPRRCAQLPFGRFLGGCGGRSTLRTGQQGACLLEPSNLGVDFCNQSVDAHCDYSPVPKIAPGRFSASAP